MEPGVGNGGLGGVAVVDQVPAILYFVHRVKTVHWISLVQDVWSDDFVFGRTFLDPGVGIASRVYGSLVTVPCCFGFEKFIPMLVFVPMFRCVHVCVDESSLGVAPEGD